MPLARAAEDIAGQPAPIDVRERRMAQRVTTLMRAAKLIGLTGEYPCVVRDVSETGIRLKLFHPLPESRVALELAPGLHYFVEKVWEGEREAGFISAAAIEVDEFLAAIGRKDGPVWFKVGVSGSLTTRNARAAMEVCALSQQGAEIETGVHLALDELVVLNVDGLPPIHARIAGLGASGYRLLLANAFRLDELARLIWSLPRWETDSRLELLEGGKTDGESTVVPIKA